MEGDSPPEPSCGSGPVAQPSSSLKPNALMALKHLGLMGAIGSYVAVRSAELGDVMGVSQQSASNLLMALEDMGMVERQMGSRGQKVKITAEGAHVLRREHNDFHEIFERDPITVITGTVVTGLGEGKYYVGHEGYRARFLDVLGFAPEHGTLNLALDEDGMHQLVRLRDSAGGLVEGFTMDGRTFGDVKCIPCRIRESPAAIIIPVRTHHRDVMEVVSTHRLRDEYGLSDGDLVEVVIEG